MENLSNEKKNNKSTEEKYVWTHNMGSWYLISRPSWSKRSYSSWKKMRFD